MPRLSKQKREKICEQILTFLFESSPKPKFTCEIAKELARDEEFIKNILLELEKKKLVISVKKSPFGSDYKRRNRWLISPEAYSVYKSFQNKF